MMLGMLTPMGYDPLFYKTNSFCLISLSQIPQTPDASPTTFFLQIIAMQKFAEGEAKYVMVPKIS
jgi:hypothetical protein